MTVMDEATRVCINDMKQRLEAELRHVGGLLARADLDHDEMKEKMEAAERGYDMIIKKLDVLEGITSATNEAIVQLAYHVTENQTDIIDRLVALKDQLNQVDMTTCLTLNDRGGAANVGKR